MWSFPLPRATFYSSKLQTTLQWSMQKCTYWWFIAAIVTIGYRCNGYIYSEFCRWAIRYNKLNGNLSWFDITYLVGYSPPFHNLVKRTVINCAFRQRLRQCSKRVKSSPLRFMPRVRLQLSGDHATSKLRLLSVATLHWRFPMQLFGRHDNKHVKLVITKRRLPVCESHTRLHIYFADALQHGETFIYQHKTSKVTKHAVCEHRAAACTLRNTSTTESDQTLVGTTHWNVQNLQVRFAFTPNPQ